jgi:hypothetical protein
MLKMAFKTNPIEFLNNKPHLINHEFGSTHTRT